MYLVSSTRLQIAHKHFSGHLDTVRTDLKVDVEVYVSQSVGKSANASKNVEFLCK